jgi:hypothetical protein
MQGHQHDNDAPDQHTRLLVVDAIHRKVAEQHTHASPGKQAQQLRPLGVATIGRHRHQIAKNQQGQHEAGALLGRKHIGKNGNEQGPEAGHSCLGHAHEHGSRHQ